MKTPEELSTLYSERIRCLDCEIRNALAVGRVGLFSVLSLNVIGFYVGSPAWLMWLMWFLGCGLGLWSVAAVFAAVLARRQRAKWNQTGCPEHDDLHTGRDAAGR